MYSKILFIDAQVEDYQSLISEVIPEAIVVVLDATQDGIGQITQCLTRHPFSEIHIVSHGAPGCLYLGNRQLNLDTLNQYTAQLRSWSADSILLYGCNVAAGDAGSEFVEKLHQITRAEIAASTTKIGHISQGGNWELDVKTSEFEAVLAFNSRVKTQWNHTLGDPFDAEPGYYQVLSGQLNALNIFTGQYEPIGNAQSPAYNATGYNPVDNYIYALQGGKVIRVSADGSIENVKDASGADIEPPTDVKFAGDIDADGNYWLRSTNTEFVKVDLTTGASETYSFTGSGGGVADIVARKQANGDTIFYGFVGDTMYEWVLPNGATSGTVSRKTVTGLTGSGGYGAAWTGLDGSIHAFNNANGKIYEITDYLGATPSAAEVLQSTPNSSNDGMSSVLQNTIFIVPMVDLDGDNSSGATGYDYQTTFTEGDGGVTITSPNDGDEDTDTRIRDYDQGIVSSGTVTLTNPQAGDELVVDTAALPSTITANVSTNGSGEIVVTLTTASGTTEADFEQALEAITFNNTSDNPDTTPRNIDVVLTDPNGFSGNIATTTIDIIPVNDEPVATDDSFNTTEDTVFTATLGVDDLLLNDTDIDGDTLTVNTTPVTDPTNGTLTLNNDGTFSYTPAPGFSGTDTFVYEVSDGNGGFATATVTLNVGAVNDDPVATDDNFGTNEDTTSAAINLLGNDTDDDGDTLSLESIDGTAITPGTPQSIPVTNGTVNVDAEGVVTFTPDANYNGPIAFDYVVSDGNGSSDTATVNGTVTPVNDDPVATDNSNSVDEDAVTATSGNVIADDNGSGVDSDIDGNSLTVSDVNGTTVTTDTDITGTYGTLTINDDGSYEYSVDNTNSDVQALGVGDSVIETFTYTVSDGNGGTDTATIEITVNGMNDNPVATDNSNGVTKTATTPATGNVIDDNDGDGVDSDIDGDSINITDVNGTPVTTGTTVTGTFGTLTINDDGSYSYSVDTTNTDVQALGDSDTLDEIFTYTLTDSQGGTDTADLTFTVSGSNDAPVATDNSNSVDEDATTPVTGNVIDDDNGSGVDSDLNNDPLTVSEVNGEDVAGATTIDGTYGTITINPDGSYEYSVDTTNPDVKGLGSSETLTETITYVVSDGKGGEDAAELSITINGINDTPVAENDNTTTGEDTPVTIDVTGNDTDDEDGTPTGVITITTQPTSGTVTVDDNDTPTDPSDDQVIYTPNPDYVGDDTFAYTVTDSEGSVSDPATVSVTVSPVNDTPIAIDDSTTTDEETPVTIDVRGNDTDVEDTTPTGDITIIGQPENGTIEIDDNGTPTDPSDDQVIYTPDEDFVGDDTFTYTVTDSEGVTSEQATVTVSVGGVNDVPVANDDGATTDEDTPVTVNVRENDTDVEDTTPTGDITITTPPTNGTVTVDNNDTPDDTSDDTVVYTPNPDYVGTDSFSYTITDSDGTPSNPATVTLSVGGVNDQPVAVDDAVTTGEDTPITVDVSENDTDTEDTIPTGVITIIDEPENGTVSIDDNDTPDDTSDDQVLYTPDENYVGDDSFSYTITDSEGLPSNTGTVSVTVGPNVNDVPVGNDDGVVTVEDTPVTIDVRENDTDVEDGIPPTGGITITSQPTNGTVTIDDNGTPDDKSDDQVVYTPNPEFNGTDTFTYTVDDSEGTPTEPTNVNVDVASINDTPVANEDEVITPENTPVTIDVAENDTDVEDGIPTGVINIIDQPTNGTVTIDDKGTPDTSDDEVLYTPNPDFDGTDTFTYTIEDSEGQPSSVATVTVTVDDPGIPVAEDDGTTTPAETPVTINVLENDTDNVEILPETVAIVDNPGNGTVTVNPDGTVEYTPNPGFVGEETFTYTVTDDEGNVSEPATVSVIVQDPDTDTDGDGIPDVDDLDDDNDGILDTEDGPGDTDGDGIPDIVDLDSDNDGIADIVESGLTPEQIAELDTDGDGVIDPTNEFGDNGVVDTVETTPDSGELDLDGDGVADEPVDTDNDGTPDFQDLDSDNDGLNDIVEAGNPDVDGNGIIDDPTDTDGDGLADSVDPDNGGTLTTPPDIDNDGAVDYRDLDSDNDGIPDLVEGGLDPEVVDPDGNGIIDTPDNDGDGIPDIVDGNPDGVGDEGNEPAPDTDSDGTPDYQELDSDGDGTPDRVEAGLPTGEGTPDVDGDGLIDDPTDIDNDGVPDAIDSAPGTEGGFESGSDTDGDGIPDAVDLDDDNDGILDELEGSGDTDGDGIPDIIDLDSDNDGISDLDESGLTPETIAALDTNNDGVIDPTNEFGDNGVVDSVETTPDSGELDLDGDGIADEPVDTDGDGVADFQDLDSDNDGIDDIIEGGLDDPEGDGVVNGPDSDGDGVLDPVDATVGFGDENPLEPDTDGDNVPDYRDLDSDNDGVNDIIEAGIDDPEGDGVVNGPDSDGDGIPDAVDENPDTFGDNQTEPVPDSDNDGTPDYQDLDSDGDGTNDIEEAGIDDPDGDGVVGGPDTDGDGIPDVVDENPAGFGDNPVDTDNDGILDAVDLDDDNDGILDELEGSGDTDGDGIPDIIDLDSDNDGIADIVESGLTPEQIAELDTDGDGVIDPTNEFGDNGVVDTVETTPDSGELDLDGDGVADNPVDTDGDNVPDFQDLDSDNDGINDIVEAGNPDVDGDGQIDDPTDSDGDGLADAVDPDNGGTLTTPADTDGDNAPDFRDLDSDNDGINDIVEAGIDDPEGDGIVNGPDNDGDGILSQADPNDNSFGDRGEGVVRDTDNDGIPDFRDLDSDGDGKNDIEEAGLADPDGDGMVNGPDSDGDGIPDAVDLNNGGFGDIPSDDILPDTDNDGIPDFQDLSGSPVAVDDEVTVPANAILNVKVLNNDTDPDGDPLNLLEFDSTSNNGGTVTLDGDTLLYIPAADFTGVDTFTYTISDGKGGTDTATVTITVTEVIPFTPSPVVAEPSTPPTPQPETNSAPMAMDDNQTLIADTNVTIDVLGNDSDPDGDSFSLDQFDAVSANGGTVTLEGDQLVYTPAAGFEGTDTFTYTIVDSNGETGTATVTLSVEAEGTNLDETLCCGSCPTVPTPEPVVLPEEPTIEPVVLPEPPDAIDANINGSDADDILEGTEEADLVNAGAGDDITLMFASNDTLLAGAGDDMGFAGQGDDLMFGDTGNDLLWGDLDNDTLIGSPSGYQPLGDAGEKDTLFGNVGDDLLAGSLGQDNIHGGQGNDRAHGGKDDDMVFGELGNDTLMGEQGDDTILGGTSNATTEDIGGRDLLFGGAGEDFLEGNQGNDTLVAGVGNDTAHGGKDDDLVYGNAGDDMLYGELGNDTLIGGPSGAEPLGEMGDQDILYGLDGDDWLAGNLGRDTLFGGIGNDIAHGGKDDDWVAGEIGNDTLLGEQGNDTIIGGTANNADNLVRDFNGADLLFGNGGDDWMEGNEGMDTLAGGDGNDTTYGGQGNDLLFGEAGNDWMWGDAGDDTLCGGTGNDTLIGGMGNDTLLAGDGNDTFILSADMGIDLISDFQMGQDVLLLEGIDFNQLDMVQQGNNTQISLNNQLIAVLEQVNVDEITNDSFI
ncbi:MAG: Ig-like domain-containing protein [Microcoleaceae cyanobacterium]